MDVRCERCQARYVVDDGLVDEAGLAVRCSKCGHLFRVTREPRGWRLRHHGGGDVTVGDTSALQRWIIEGKAHREDEVSRDGGPWVRAGALKDLEPFFAVVDKASRAPRSGHSRAIPDDEPTLDIAPPARDVWEGPAIETPSSTEPAWAAETAPVPGPGRERRPEPRRRRSRGSRLPWVLAAIAAVAAAVAAIYLENPGWLGLERSVSGGAPASDNGDVTPPAAAATTAPAAPTTPASPSPMPPPASPMETAPKPGAPAEGAAAPAGSPPGAAAPAQDTSAAAATPPAAAPGAATAPPVPVPGTPAAPPSPPAAPAAAQPAAAPGAGPAGRPQPGAAPATAGAAAEHGAEPGAAAATTSPPRAGTEPSEARTEPAPSPAASPSGASAEVIAPPPVERPAAPPGKAEKPAAVAAAPARRETPQTRLRALLSEGHRLRDRGRSEAALDAYARAVQLEPTNADALAGRGLCYLDLSQYGPAEENFKAALSANGDNAAALMGLAETYRYEGRRAEAVTYYRKYLAVHPRGEDATAARNAISALEESP